MESKIPSNEIKNRNETKEKFNDSVEENDLYLTRVENLDDDSKSNKNSKSYKIEIVWGKLLFLVYLHLGAMYGLYLCFTSAQFKTILFAYFLYLFGGLGVGSGAHRLWSHRSYKATPFFRFLLAFMDTVAFQASIFEWSRDHRVHHKFSETDADPYNAKRGFFFSHMGWLMLRKHPDVIEKGKKINLQDLLDDKIVQFQHRHYLLLSIVFAFTIPTLIPMYFWNESLKNSFFVSTLLRICFLHHCVWLVNSAAHMWGYRPYDKNIAPAENRFVSIGVAGEGYHNYHHTFPWDYSTSEGGWSLVFNLSTTFLDCAAFFGWVYDRKKVPDTVIKARKERTGNKNDPSYF